MNYYRKVEKKEEKRKNLVSLLVIMPLLSFHLLVISKTYIAEVN